MSRYEQPIDYNQDDYARDVDTHAAFNSLGPYAPKGVNDVGEVMPQPPEPEPAPEPLPAPTFKGLLADNRRKLAEYRAENPDGWDWIVQTEKWRGRLEEKYQ